MKRKPRALPVRNPFVVLALKRAAGTHRKSQKAVRRSEKVNLKRDVAQLAQSTRLLTDRPRFDSGRPYQGVLMQVHDLRKCFRGSIASFHHFSTAL